MVVVGPDPMKIDADPTQVEPAETEFPSSYKILLSLNLDGGVYVPAEATFATVEPHGAIVLSRLVSGEQAQRFELSGAEFETLLRTCRRRKRLLKRATLAVLASPEFPF